uniref:AIG1-type G domain-containing protein n=1 Tax=Pygocentrus nattereri TaxID=42514 RepID=A0A3B4C2J1_PYGNA
MGSGDTHHLSELRIVLLGFAYTGKSSAGNTILNREEFELKRTALCVKRQREVAGRNITVVEAPGWWSNKPVEDSTELLKQEIVLSVSLCPPGPHALLLVVNVVSVFKENERKILDGYLELLTDSLWSHTIVLFTCGDCLGDTPIEQHIESEGKELQWLVEKCGNRYHVLNNKNWSDDTQVTELLEKIEEMVAANSGRPFEMDRKILQEVEEKRRAEEERAKERMMKVKKQKKHNRSQIGDTHHLSELRIVLLGVANIGKSSAGNTILNREEFELKRTAQCVKRQREVAGRNITVVEAPGWWSNNPVEESTELLKQEIVLSVSLCPPGPHALLLVVNVVNVFKENERKILDGYLELLTDSLWSHTIVLFTCGDCLGDISIEHHIESEGKELQWLVEKCGNRYHVLNNKNWSDDTQVTELLEKIEEMVAANSGRPFEMDRKILQEVEEKRRAEEERAKERMMKVKKQKKHNRSQIVNMEESSDKSLVGGSFRSRTADFYASAHSIDSSHTSGNGSLRSIPESLHLERSNSLREPPTMSREKSSDKSSVGGSFRSRLGPSRSSTRSKDSSHSSGFGSLTSIPESLHLERSDSMREPLTMSKEKSDTWSLGSSAYGSFRSRSGPDSDSVYGSARSSVSAHSSRSLPAIPKSVQKPKGKVQFPKIGKFFRLSSSKEDNEDTAAVEHKLKK